MRTRRLDRGAACRALVLAALLSAPFLSSPALALDPARRTTQYVTDAWTQDDGLPQNGVNAIAQTPDGYLWLGTEEGLVRFDGARFTVFDRRTTPEIRNNFIMALHADRAGDLWIGTFGGGLLRLRKGRFELFTKKDGLSNDRIRSIHEDRAGTIWIATGGGGLSKYEKGRFSALTTKDGLASDRVWSVAEDARGRLVIGTFGGGLQFLEGGVLSAQSLGPVAAAAFVRPVCLDREGNLWVGTDGGGLYRIRKGEVRSFGVAEGLTSPLVRALCADRNGNLWVGTDGAGLFRYQGGRFEPFTTKDGLANDFILSLFEDREGSLWIGTSGGGLARLRDGKLTNLTTRQGLGHDVVRAVIEDHAGALWAGTTGGGVTRFADGKATTLRTADGLVSDLVFALHEDRAGRLWIGTDGAGVNVLERGRLRRLTTADGLVNDRIRAICDDRDGNVWIGTISGLSRYRDGSFTSFTTKEGLAGSAVRSLLSGRDGSLWIGTDGGGLGRLKDGKFSSWKTADGLSSARVFSLHEDERGTLWIGTSGGGLNRLSGGKLRAITSADGLLDDVVFQILDDGAGFLWMSCNRGIFRVSRDELDRFADGHLSRVKSQAFGRSDGMASAECSGGSPAGWRTRDGRLFFPTIKGVTSVDPARLTTNRIVPSVLVEELLVDGRPVPIGDGLRLEPGTERLELHYTATSLRVPQKVRFRYRLEGFDRDWVDAGTRRSATYTNLPHGPYTFHVVACNDDDLWNEKGAIFAFSMQPHYYQTWWFYSLCALGVAAVGAGIQQARVGQLKTRQRELVRLVDEKTNDVRRANENLQSANQRLLEAQEKISRLLASSPGASESLPEWSRAVAEEIAVAIGAKSIGIWEVDRDGVTPVSDSGVSPPSRDTLERLVRSVGREPEMSSDGTIVPVTGMSGELCGALVVSGNDIPWGETEKRLVAGFAHQLGAALDMNRMRKRLAVAEERRAASLSEMHEQGIATLQVCPKCGRCFDHTVASCAWDGAGLDSPRPLPYRLLGRYRFVRVLGQGGMGVVYTAHDEKLGRDVAVKLIRPEQWSNASTKRRFEREAHAVAHIQHPGVVELHDSGELDDGTAFLVMERLAGCDLRLLTNTHGRGTPSQVARLIRQGFAALRAAHRAGLVHRDIKPENVFIVDDPSGFRVKLLDFGLAKTMKSAEGLTQSGVILGTPVYMAPEQVQGEDVDTRADVYSFAAVAYEALTGRRAIEGNDLGRILIQVLNAVPPSVSSLVPGISPDVDAAFESALAKDPARRLKDIELWGSSFVELLEASQGDAATVGWPNSRNVFTQLRDSLMEREPTTDLPGIRD